MSDPDRLAAMQARAAELQTALDTADEPEARRLSDELHAIMDALDRVYELPPRRVTEWP